jgi:hypothetical protein
VQVGELRQPCGPSTALFGLVWRSWLVLRQLRDAVDGLFASMFAAGAVPFTGVSRTSVRVGHGVHRGHSAVPVSM